MVKKAPRRTAERILEVSLDLFNKFGEPNVSTTLISGALGISPGNLYYHFPAKDELVNALFDRYEAELRPLLLGAVTVNDLEGSWHLLQRLFELNWAHRFLFRDLNDLLSKNRHLETHFQQIQSDVAGALTNLLQRLRARNVLQMEAGQVETTTSNLMVILCYWFSFVYVQTPRLAASAEQGKLNSAHGTHQALSLLTPWLEAGDRLLLQELSLGEHSGALQATTS